MVFLFVYEISRELLNRYVPNSHGSRVSSHTLTSLKVKVKGQGHQGQKQHFSALLVARMRFVSGKTSLASSCNKVKVICHKAASPPHMDGSVISAKWCECTPHI